LQFLNVLPLHLDLVFVLRAAARSQASCIPSHVSGVLPKALVSRIAISGLMPDLPFGADSS
jgi:hypothetical protein